MDRTQVIFPTWIQEEKLNAIEVNLEIKRENIEYTIYSSGPLKEKRNRINAAQEDATFV